MTTVTDLQNTNQLHFFRGNYNIIDCGIRTGKTYWAVNNLQQFTRDGRLNRILFLTDTNALKSQMLNDYEERCIEADKFWEKPSEWGEQIDKIGVMCYQSLGARAMRDDLAFLDYIDVICWDECDSIFDFASQAFVRARKTDFARKDASNNEVLAIIQQYSSQKAYMPLVLLGMWQKLIVQGRIMCIGLSASPERARAYYQGLVSASNKGKLDAGYRIAADIYFYNLVDHLLTLQPMSGRGYWCYSPYINENKNLVNLLNERGFNAIEIHSLQNEEKPMTEEQKRVYNCIVATHLVPIEYDFVIVNAALQRGITIEDKRFNNIIINSTDEAVRIQAARMTHEYQRHLKMAVPAVPRRYKDRWLTVSECRQLAAEMAVPENQDTRTNKNYRPMAWNKLKDFLPTYGYTIKKASRSVDGKRQQCYYIEGEWVDVLPPDEAFEALLNAAYEARELE